MIIKSAEINKFKSINTENNMVFFDKTVTALIGKNESGKSNILESIGLIKNLFLPLGTEYLNNKTRGQNDNASIIYGIWQRKISFCRRWYCSKL